MKTLLAIFAVTASSLFSTIEVSASDSEMTASDTVTVASRPIVKLTMPLSLTARDFITKVYGFIDPGSTRPQCIAAASRVAAITPQEDEYGLWLNDSGGYSVSYYGMRPQVEAMARFTDNESKVSEYAFFFLFPYTRGTRHSANERQAEFCGSLLQELHDMGLEIGQPQVTDAIFEAVGDYAGNMVDLRLIEEFIAPDGENRADAMTATVEKASIPDVEGRFILVLHVQPGAFTEADSLAASD